MVNRITEHIDIWTAAQAPKTNGAGRGNGAARNSLHGIKKLRELILELAVRGKLVPQDPNDEPASELLKKIAREKARLIKEGKIKKQNPLPEISEDEKPFELPERWAWVYLSDIVQIVGGGTPKSSEPTYWADDEIKWLTPADLYGLNEKYISAGRRDISSKGLEASSATLLPVGAVLFSSRAPIGYVAIAGAELATNQGFKSCVPYVQGMSEYVYYFLKRSARKIDSQASGTTFKEISGAGMSKVLFALPPLAEQQRIVVKVDELMALCDQLEQQQIESSDTHQILVETLLASLTNAADQKECASAWQRIASHFDILFTTKQSIDQLKQTILQLAVMGKLVPQDSNNLPASDLLKKIAREKARLIKEGKIKKEKPLPEISEDEKPFELPAGWVWVRLGDIASTRLGKMLDKSKNRGNPRPYLRNTNVQWHSFALDDVKEMRFEDSELDEYRVQPGDLLICEGGEPGRCAIWEDPSKEIYFQKAIHRVRPFSGVAVEFLQVSLTKDAKNGDLGEYFTGATIKHFPGEKLNRYLFPLPPKSEQHRIIAKVDELMAICDALKARLNEAQTTQVQLADAIVEQAVA